MSPSQQVLLMTAEPATTAAVASALELNGRFANDGVCRNLSELVDRLESSPNAGVLVDIDPQPSRILADLDAIITKFGDARFIVLATAHRDELVLEAMQIGARHFLLKESIGADLAGAFQRLIRRSLSAMQGKVVTVLGSGGGCGATTIAINLANELHLVASERVLLVDLDCWYGAVGAYLGLKGQYGIEDVLADSNRIDGQLIHSTALEYGDGLRALISPAGGRYSEPGPLQYEHLGRVVAACKDAYRYTVIDSPRVTMSVAADLAHASELTLIVFQLSVKDIRVARDTFSALRDRGVPPNRIMPLVSRYRKRHSMITLEEAQTALGKSVVIGRISNDYKSAIRGINYGQPLADAAKRSSLRREIRQIAAKIHKSCSVEQQNQGVGR